MRSRILKNILRIAAAVMMAFLSGFTLAYIAIGTLGSLQFAFDMDEDTANALALGVLFVVFAVGWIATSIFINAVSIALIFRRGFLILAAEWLIQIAVSIGNAIVGIAVAVNQPGDSPFTHALTLLLGGASILMNVGFAIAMAIASMIGYAVSVFFPVEFAKESMSQNLDNQFSAPTRKMNYLKLTDD